MKLTQNDKLNLALEIMSEKDIEKFLAVEKLAETKKEIDIWEALTEYETKHNF